MTSHAGHTQVTAAERTTRRAFLHASLAAGAIAAKLTAAQDAPAEPSPPNLCLFSKPLGGRRVADLPALLGAFGCEALDLTCRPEGHVLPERAADDLPQACELLKAGGIRVAMLTTGILSTDDPHAEPIFKTAASLGIRDLKLGYYRYEDLTRIEQTLADVKAKLRDLVQLAREHGVRLGFHNHSGPYVGGPMWDLDRLLRDLPADAIGSYFDAAHATAEGGGAGWEIGLNLLAPRITMLSVKDVGWERDPKAGWRHRWVPLGEGMVQWNKVLARLKQQHFAGPISLHVEYLRPAPAGSEQETEVLKAVSRDWKRAQELVRAGLR